MDMNVYIVGNYGMYSNMFKEEGWNIADTIFDSDLVVFCGGEDVDPVHYGQNQHATTYSNYKRDEAEKNTYTLAKELGLPCAGICRGGQFLHVMNGGKLYQDVDKHAISGTHEAYIVGMTLLNPVHVSSTHHQMMKADRLNKNQIVLMVAKLSTYKKEMSPAYLKPVEYNNVLKDVPDNDKEDLEAVYYNNTNDLCFQPHPEFGGEEFKQTRQVFFNFVKNYLFDVKKEG